jgi:tetrahydromethanopterin S-methyltransferase subunit G
MLASGSDILDSLSSEMHTATRSLAKAAGGTAAPEGVAERVEDIWRRVEEMEGKVEEGVKKALGRDEL